MSDTPKVVDPIDECVHLGRENAELQAALKCEREWVLALTKDNGLLLKAVDKTKAGALAVHLAGRIEKLEDDKAALERENAALRADLLIEEERSIYWRDNEGKAMAENAALRADKERLDWLDAAGYLRKNVNIDGVWKEWEISTDETELTLRAAIDAAMGKFRDATKKEAQP